MESQELKSQETHLKNPERIPEESKPESAVRRQRHLASAARSIQTARRRWPIRGLKADSSLKNL